VTKTSDGVRPWVRPTQQGPDFLEGRQITNLPPPRHPTGANWPTMDSIAQLLLGMWLTWPLLLSFPATRDQNRDTKLCRTGQRGQHRQRSCCSLVGPGRATARLRIDGGGSPVADRDYPCRDEAKEAKNERTTRYKNPREARSGLGRVLRVSPRNSDSPRQTHVHQTHSSDYGNQKTLSVPPTADIWQEAWHYGNQQSFPKKSAKTLARRHEREEVFAQIFGLGIVVF